MRLSKKGLCPSLRDTVYDNNVYAKHKTIKKIPHNVFLIFTKLSILFSYPKHIFSSLCVSQRRGKAPL